MDKKNTKVTKTSWETHDADKLDPVGLEMLFEPNEDLYVYDKESNRMVLQSDRECALDKIAQIGSDFILVAERGVGKTHILNLLREKIKENNGVVIEINPDKDDNNPFHRYPIIEEKYPEESKDKIWKYVILEAIVREIAPHLPSFKKFMETAENILRGIKLVYRRQDDPMQSVEVSYAPLTNPAELPTELTDAIDQLDKKVWKYVRSVGRQRVGDFKRLNPLVSRYIPSFPCVYVIADKLDQEKSEKVYEIIATSLAGLVNSIESLNIVAKQKKEIKRRVNFKAIVALRAITFYHSVKSKLDWTLQDGELCELTWTPGALKRMMAQRILGEKRLDEEVPETIIYGTKALPPKVHFFGKEFDGIDFFFEMAGHRPRAIIVLWECCVKRSDERAKSYFFTAKLSEGNLSRCSKFLLHLNRFGLSLSRKETKSHGSFQIDIPCVYPSSRNGTQQSEGSRSQTCPSLAFAA